MVREGSGFQSNVVLVSTRRTGRPFDDDFEPVYGASSKASRISSSAMEDSYDMQRKSRKSDQQLMSDITSRLYKLDFDRVKPCREVAQKTGFRRHIYQRKVPLDAETKESRKKDELLYPWDYTMDNTFRNTKKKAKRTVERQEKQRRKERKFTLDEEQKEEQTKDHYPAYDPLGLYRPRPQKEPKLKQSAAELLAIQQKVEDMNIRELVSKVKAKSRAAPTCRPAVSDIDAVLRDLTGRPLQKQEQEVIDYKPFSGFDTGYGFSDYEVTEDRDKGGLDPRIAKLITNSKGDLAEFEQKIAERFRYRPKHQTQVDGKERSESRRYSLEGERELGPGSTFDDEDDYVSSVRVRKHMPGPNYYGGGRPVETGFRRATSVPPARAVNVTRVSAAPSSGDAQRRLRMEAMQDRIEADAYTVTPPQSLASLRSRALNVNDKIDMHKRMMDRYLPIHMGPENEVQYEVEAKYGELASRQDRRNCEKMARGVFAEY